MNEQINKQTDEDVLKNSQREWLAPHLVHTQYSSFRRENVNTHRIDVDWTSKEMLRIMLVWSGTSEPSLEYHMNAKKSWEEGRGSLERVIPF